MTARVEQFIRERQYLHNVTPATVEWYRQSLKWLESERPTQAELNTAVIRMRGGGRSAAGCNCALRAINAYMHWTSGSERKCGAACTHPRIAPLKEFKNVLATFNEAQVRLS